MDAITQSVIHKHATRAAAGLQKYGTTMARQDLSRLEWLRHAQEEAMDLAIYLERLIQDEIAAQQPPAQQPPAQHAPVRILCQLPT